MSDQEIPEEAYERATDAIAAFVNSWPASASHPFHPELGVRETLRAFAITALEAAALPHLRVQETPADGLRDALLGKMAALVERAEDGEPHLFLNVSLSELEDLLVAHPATHPRPVVDREALIKQASEAHMQVGRKVYVTDACSCDWFGDNFALHFARSVLALLPSEEGEDVRPTFDIPALKAEMGESMTAQTCPEYYPVAITRMMCVKAADHEDEHCTHGGVTWRNREVPR